MLSFILLFISITNALPENCKIRASDKHCLECNDGYYLVLQDTEESGIPNVYCAKAANTANCKYYEGTTCVQCNEGYYLSGGSCLECPANCLHCGMIDSVLTCVQCDTGYTLSVTETECLDCTVSTNYEKCGYCTGNRYFDISTKSCQDCLEGCSLCTENYNCLQCADGYILSRQAGNEEATSVSPDSCIEITNCQSIIGDHCEVCNEGYTLQRGTCVQCPTNCVSCYLENIDDVNSAKCTACSSNYIPLNGECVTLDSANCATGSSGYGCLKCKDGYYFDANYLCVQCTGGCKTCVDSADNCLSCKDNYYFSTSNGKSVCLQMDANCKL